MNDIEAYAELIRTVRDKYPKALIFCLSAVLNLVMTAGDRIVGQSDKETTDINRQWSHLNANHIFATVKVDSSQARDSQ